MRNQQPDNFFRERLADYQKPAPAGAWDRIETSLKKTEVKFAWWKIAASLLLLTTIGYVLWLQSSEANEQPPIAKTQSEIEPNANPVSPETDRPEKSQYPEETKTEKSSTATAPNSTDKKVKSKPIKSPKKNVTELASTLPNNVDESFQPVENPTSETVSDQVAAAIQPLKKSSSITLTVTVEEADKYLDKNALAEATSKERKSSTFKKLLKKANELTSNQDPFGDLRVKKNEILALEFKNDKRGQNK